MTASTALIALAPATAEPKVSTNHAFYDAAMAAAKRVGDNLQTLGKNKRALAVDLVRASRVEDFALNEAITEAKKAMRWGKLDSKDQNQINQVFRDVRTIDGGWVSLSAEDQDQFLKGELTPSTLAAKMRAAEKAAVEEAGKAEDDKEKAEAERARPIDSTGHVLPAHLEAAHLLTAWVKGQTVEGLAPAEALALHTLWEAMAALRAGVAGQAQAA